MDNCIKVYLGLLIAILIFVLNGCATIVHGTTQSIPISTDPSGAEIVVDGTERHTSPINVILKRKFDHNIDISKEGYQKETVNIKSVLSGAVAGNILAGGLIGWGVDAASGAQWRLVPETINLRLRPEVTQAKVAPAIEREASIEEKLDQIRKLKDRGKITEEEYSKMRSDILSGTQRSKTISAPASTIPVRYQPASSSPQIPKKETIQIEPEKGVPKPETNNEIMEVQ
jgi:hypothetical protein